VRFLSFNVQGFAAGVDRVAEVIRVADPAVIALQEADHANARELAHRLGYNLSFTPSRMFREPGNAILAREPITEYWKVRLSKTRGLVRRGATGATLTGDIHVYSAHLGLSGAERERHAAELLRETFDGEGRVVIGVDLNEGTSGTAYRALVARFTDVFAAAGEGSGESFPATAPRERMDFVFCSRAFMPKKATVVPLVASDHLAILAELEG
jgi:endonuclease/exonuclease/phosphatase family metal-dependent hydrolase